MNGDQRYFADGVAVGQIFIHSSPSPFLSCRCSLLSAPCCLVAAAVVCSLLCVQITTFAYDFQTYGLPPLAPLFPKLQLLSLSFLLFKPDFLSSIDFQQLHHLQHLRLSRLWGCKLPKLPPSLTRLELFSCDFTDDQLSCLTLLPNLLSLRFSHCRSLIGAIVGALPASVVSLSFIHCQDLDSSLSVLPPNLTHLTLRGAPFPATILAWSQWRTHQHLRQLDFGHGGDILGGGDNLTEYLRELIMAFGVFDHPDLIQPSLPPSPLSDVYISSPHFEVLRGWMATCPTITLHQIAD
jgi:hypothetical protein